MAKKPYVKLSRAKQILNLRINVLQIVLHEVGISDESFYQICTLDQEVASADFQGI